MQKPGKKHREVDTFTALLSIIDFIDNEMPGVKNLGTLKAALVIWRKTHGWGKIAEGIGTKQLQLLTGLARSTIQHNIDTLRFLEVAEPTATTRKGNTRHLRRIFTWPINDRVRELLKKAGRARGGEGSSGGGAPRDEATPGRRTPPRGDSSGGRGVPRDEATRGSKTPPPEGAQRGDSSDYSLESSTSTPGESLTSAASGRQMSTVKGAQPGTDRFGTARSLPNSEKVMNPYVEGFASLFAQCGISFKNGDLERLLTMGAEKGLHPELLARFVMEKYDEKQSRGEAIQSMAFFFHALPVEAADWIKRNPTLVNLFRNKLPSP